MVNWHLEKAEIVRWKDKSNFNVGENNPVLITLDPPELFSSRNAFRLFLFWRIIAKASSEEEDLLDCKFENIFEITDIKTIDAKDIDRLLNESLRLLKEQFKEKSSGTNFESLLPTPSKIEKDAASTMLKSKIKNTI